MEKIEIIVWEAINDSTENYRQAFLYTDQNGNQFSLRKKQVSYVWCP